MESGRTNNIEWNVELDPFEAGMDPAHLYKLHEFLNECYEAAKETLELGSIRLDKLSPNFHIKDTVTIGGRRIKVPVKAAENLSKMLGIEARRLGVFGLLRLTFMADLGPHLPHRDGRSGFDLRKPAIKYIWGGLTEEGTHFTHLNLPFEHQLPYQTDDPIILRKATQLATEPLPPESVYKVKRGNISFVIDHAIDGFKQPFHQSPPGRTAIITGIAVGKPLPVSAARILAKRNAPYRQIT